MAAARTESKMYGFIYYKLQLHSDFVTNSYGESWDSSCEQIMSPSPEPWSPSSENNKVLNIKCVGLYVTRQIKKTLLSSRTNTQRNVRR